MQHKLQEALELAVKSLIAKGIISQTFTSSIKIDQPREKKHGDLSTNLALICAKPSNQRPMFLAQRIIEAIPNASEIGIFKIAEPGFINVVLKNDTIFESLTTCMNQGKNFGKSSKYNNRILVEYVSANPTGPLHVGHGRGAAYGATLVNLLRSVGNQVCSEYYVNDAGRQINILSVSVWLKYLENQKVPITYPASGYQGRYIDQIAEILFSRKKKSLVPEIANDILTDNDSQITPDEIIDKWIIKAQSFLEDNWEDIKSLSLNFILTDIEADLKDFGASFEKWFSEADLFKNGHIDRVLERLLNSGDLYTNSGALWLHSTRDGDDKDRVVRRANGETTYFASDLAYLENKFERGFEKLIYVWGADHHGYIKRLKSGCEALGYESKRIEIKLVQFANLIRKGTRIPMSTRTGDFVTLRSLREDVGEDACRFFYVMRKPEQHLDFNIDLALSKTRENPVFYIQYAHARICRILDLSEQKILDIEIAKKSLQKSGTEVEKEIVMKIAQYPDLILSAAESLEPHQICYFLQEIAGKFHKWYDQSKILVSDHEERAGKVAIAMCVKQIIANGLEILGVNAPKSM